MYNEMADVYETVTTALGYVKNLVNDYLKKRKYDQSYDGLVKEYELRDLVIQPKPEIPDSIVKEIYRKVYAFYFNLKLCEQLIEYVNKYTNDHKDEIEHAEEILINVILDAFHEIKDQVGKNVLEVKRLFESLSIPLPNPTLGNFDQTMDRRARDFLVLKFLIEELTKVCEMLKK